MKVTEAIKVIQTELKVGKTLQNQGIRYKYRSAEQILEAVKPLLQKTGTYLVISEELLSDEVINSEVSLYDDEGEFVSANAIVGVDSEQRGMSMPQRYGSASSYGKKYALGNLFLLDDTEDADALAEAPVKKESKPNMTAEQFKKAEKFVSGGGNINAIKQKYKLTASQEKALSSK